MNVFEGHTDTAPNNSLLLGQLYLRCSFADDLSIKYMRVYMCVYCVIKGTSNRASSGQFPEHQT